MIKSLFENVALGRLVFVCGLILLAAGCLASPGGDANNTFGGTGRSSNSTVDAKDSQPVPPRDNSLHLASYRPRAVGVATGAANGLATKAATSVLAPEADPLDWPYWRGPHYNGVSYETGLPDKWNPRGGKGSNVKWKRDDLGGRSTPIVMNGKLYTLVRAEPETPREGEKVVCVNAETGKTLWENRFNVWLSDVPDTRVGWSSVVGDPETGKVYALGVCGYFQCINGETGETIWSRRLHEEFGLLSTYGGRTNFPVVADNLVIISGIVIGWGDKARPAHRFLGFDKATGEVVWFNGTRDLPYDTNYSAPTVTVLNGRKAIVFGSGDGAVWALQARTGVPIWNYEFSRRGLNVAPLVVGDTVFSGHSEENDTGSAMGAVAAINALSEGNITQSGERWVDEEIMMGKSSPVHIDGRLYCVDDRAKLHILDAKTGKAIYRRPKALGTVMRSSPLFADGKLYVFEANGRWYILKPNPDDKRDGLDEVSKGRLPTGEESHASPIASHGRVYMQTSGGLYCLEDADKKHGHNPLPPPVKEPTVEQDGTPAHVQIVPAESLIKPGESISYKVRLFNSHGQFLKESDAKFSVDGPGEFAGGNYTASGDAAQKAATITAKVGKLSGKARVRIVPDLPWKFDFEGLDDPPVVWVGARYRHIVRPKDGSNVMVKITTIPKGTRSRCWFGHPELHDYTIQADVRAARTNNKLPDIGLIAQGYTLDLQGASQKLQIRTWVPQLRMAKTIPFTWDESKWYTMKLRASVEDGKAVLRGKVWPKDEMEPAQWTVEAMDEAPNLSGSPGLYGNAKDAEIYLDNITVASNN